MKHTDSPHSISDYHFDLATGRVALKRPPNVKKTIRVTMAEFLRSDISERKKSYLRALEESAKDQERLIELANKSAPI